MDNSIGEESTINNKFDEVSITNDKIVVERASRASKSVDEDAVEKDEAVDDDTGEAWTLLTDVAHGSWWVNLTSRRSQWHPPCEPGRCWWCTGSWAWHPLAPADSGAGKTCWSPRLHGL